MEKFEKVRNNTLKMIRNNERLEDLVERIIIYARDNKDFTLGKIIKDGLKDIEIYEDMK